MYFLVVHKCFIQKIIFYFKFNIVIIQGVGNVCKLFNGFAMNNSRNTRIIGQTFFTYTSIFQVQDKPPQYNILNHTVR